MRPKLYFKHSTHKRTCQAHFDPPENKAYSHFTEDGLFSSPGGGSALRSAYPLSDRIKILSYHAENRQESPLIPSQAPQFSPLSPDSPNSQAPDNLGRPESLNVQDLEELNRSPEIPGDPLAPVQLDTQGITFRENMGKGTPLATSILKKNRDLWGSNGQKLQGITINPYSKEGRKAAQDSWREIFLAENVEMALIHKKKVNGGWPFSHAYADYMRCGKDVHVVKCQNCGGRHQIPKRCCLNFICSECSKEEALRVKYRYAVRMEKALLQNRKWGKSLMHLVLTNRVKNRVWTQKEIKASDEAVKTLYHTIYGERVCKDCRKVFRKRGGDVRCPHCRKKGKGHGKSWEIDGLMFAHDIKGYNLHNHCLVYGSRVDKRQISKLWKSLTGGEGEIIRIKEIKCKQGKAKRDARNIVGYVVKYLKKAEQFANTKEGQTQAVQWMLASQGIRGLHSYGRFYKIGKDDPRYAKAPHCCPYCGADPWSLFTDDLVTTKRMADALGIPTWYEAMGMEGLLSGRDPPEIENGWAVFKRGPQTVHKKISRLNPFDDGRPWIPGSLRVDGGASA